MDPLPVSCGITSIDRPGIVEPVISPGHEVRVEVGDIPLSIGEEGDRKSTRLNSSHVAISYAVFCLKKKKKQPSTSKQRNTRQHSQPALTNPNQPRARLSTP